MQIQLEKLEEFKEKVSCPTGRLMVTEERLLNSRAIFSRQMLFHNLITNAGKNAMARLLGGHLSGGIKFVVTGTGITIPRVEDVKLETEKTRCDLDITVNVTYPKFNVVAFSAVIGSDIFGEASGVITEAGLMMKDVDGSDILFSRLLFMDQVTFNEAPSPGLFVQPLNEDGVEIRHLLRYEVEF